jgi:hypothetical protein
MVIESRRVRWVREVARMAEMKISYKILVRNRERNRNLGKDGRLILIYS